MEIHDRIFDIEETVTVEEAFKNIEDENEKKMSKMSKISINICDASKNGNISPKSELIEKLTTMVDKIENMETVLERQSKCLSEFFSNSNTEQNYLLKVFKGTFLEIESETQKWTQKQR